MWLSTVPPRPTDRSRSNRTWQAGDHNNNQTLPGWLRASHPRQRPTWLRKRYSADQRVMRGKRPRNMSLATRPFKLETAPRHKRHGGNENITFAGVLLVSPPGLEP